MQLSELQSSEHFSFLTFSSLVMCLEGNQLSQADKFRCTFGYICECSYNIGNQLFEYLGTRGCSDITEMHMLIWIILRLSDQLIILKVMFQYIILYTLNYISV